MNFNGTHEKSIRQAIMICRPNVWHSLNESHNTSLNYAPYHAYRSGRLDINRPARGRVQL